MTTLVEQARTEVAALTLKGWAIPRQNTLHEALLVPLADGMAALEQMAADMMSETDPRTALLCLTDFERVLGADPCGRDVSQYSIPDRQALAYQRWTARGGASIPYFVAYAAARGVAITITENRVSCTDIECDFELIDEGEQFVWTVTLAALGETLFEADGGASDDSLYDLILTDIECDIRRLKPAHTEVTFVYV